MGRDGVEDALLAEPQDEARLRVVLGQPGGGEDDREERERDARAPGAQDPGRREAAAELPAAGLELAEVRADLLGQLDEPARPRLVRQDAVGPQRVEHPDEMGLAAAVEAADPHRGLRGLVEVRQVAAHDPLEAGRVLALGDEGPELVAQDRPLLVAPRLADLRHAEVRDGPRGRIAGEDVTDQRHRLTPSGMVIGMAR